MSRLTVRDVMTVSVIGIDASAAVHDARRLLEQHRLSALPVIDAGGRPVGMVSATDLLSNLEPGLPVSRVMTDHVYTVSPEEAVSAAARLMRAHGVHRLIVTDDQAAVGVVSALDLLQLLAGDDPPAPSRRSDRS